MTSWVVAARAGTTAAIAKMPTNKAAAATRGASLLNRAIEKIPSSQDLSAHAHTHKKKKKKKKKGVFGVLLKVSASKQQHEKRKGLTDLSTTYSLANVVNASRLLPVEIISGRSVSGAGSISSQACPQNTNHT